jgi:hypothetical protein
MGDLLRPAPHLRSQGNRVLLPMLPPMLPYPEECGNHLLATKLGLALGPAPTDPPTAQEAFVHLFCHVTMIHLTLQLSLILCSILLYL